MNKRFIQIKNSNGTIPVGASTQNITLPDGTILNDVLGDLNASIKGSIAQRLDKISEESEGEISLIAPHFKQGLYVDKYTDSSSNVVFQVSPSETGLSSTIVSDQLKINGTLTIEKNNTNSAGTTPVFTLDNTGIMTIPSGNNGLRISDGTNVMNIVPSQNSRTLFRSVPGGYGFQISGSGTPITITPVSAVDAYDYPGNITSTYNLFALNVPELITIDTRSNLFAFMDRVANAPKPMYFLQLAGRFLNRMVKGVSEDHPTKAWGICKVAEGGQNIRYFCIWANQCYLISITRTSDVTKNNYTVYEIVGANTTPIRDITGGNIW